MSHYSSPINLNTLPQRILVVGISCTGKSTLAERLGKDLGIPSTDIDDLFWQPNWQPQSREILREQIKMKVDQPQWVIAGNYPRTQDISWPRADLVIWLDLPLMTIYYRLLKRTLKRLILKQACCNGNYETWSGAFLSRDSLFAVIRKTATQTRHHYLSRLQAHPPIIRLRSRHQVETFVQHLSHLSKPKEHISPSQ